MRRLAIGLIVFTVGCWLAIGCVTMKKATKRPSDEATKQPSPTTLPLWSRRPSPAGRGGVESDTQADQQGGFNAALGAVTGFVHSSSMSLTLGVLLAWIMYLAHRREAAQDKALAAMNHELIEVNKMMAKALAEAVAWRAAA